jgi:Dolichyl-phosphate-mannose-protein mannosyltransferase
VVPRLSQSSQPGFWETRLAPFLQKYCLALCLCLVGIACVRIISTYDALSLTIDEPFHLAAAIEYLSDHTFLLDTENPPLARAVLALGPYLAGSRPVGEGIIREEGLAILARSGNVQRTVFLLRLGNLPFFLLACLVVFGWSWKMFGRSVAVLATGLYTLLPTVLADAGLATTDTALGATVGAAFLATIIWAERPTWLRALLLGLCAALAALSKFTALGYVSVTIFLALACYLAVRRPGRQDLWRLARQRAPTFALAAITAALLVWAAYAFSFGIVSHFRFNLPAPDFFRGILAAKAHNREGHGGYLFGEYRLTGWWYYFPVALAFKMPIAFLVLVGVGIFACLRERSRLVYLFPLAFSLGILAPAMAGRIDIGIRHIEPIYLGLSIIAALGLVQVLQWSRTGIVSALTAGVLIAWMVVSVAVHHPDYLAYFNGFAGKDPANVLVDSNYDWGQDLKFLAKRLHELGVKQVSIGSMDGVMHPGYLSAWYGLPAITLVDDSIPTTGWTVVSATFDKSFRLQFTDRPTVPNPWYDQIAPTERVGPLRLYYITPAQRAQFVH